MFFHFECFNPPKMDRWLSAGTTYIIHQQKKQKTCFISFMNPDKLHRIHQQFVLKNSEPRPDVSTFDLSTALPSMGARQSAGSSPGLRPPGGSTTKTSMESMQKWMEFQSPSILCIEHPFPFQYPSKIQFHVYIHGNINMGIENLMDIYAI